VVTKAQKWIGKCPSCGNWNTFVEEVIHKESSQKKNGWSDYHDEKETSRAVALNDITSGEQKRIITPDAELNRVLRRGHRSWKHRVDRR